MKDIIVTVLVLLNSGFVAFLCGFATWQMWKRQGRLEPGVWIGLILFGVPALIVFAGTVLGFK